MKKHLFIILLIFTGFKGLSQNLWSVKSSEIEFSIKNAGLTVKGSFSGLVAYIRFSENNSEKSQIEAFLYPAFINTGISKRDRHLKSSDYFHVEKHPRIILKSIKIEPLGQKRFMGYFLLSIKDVTKEIKFPFIFEQNGNTGIFKGDFSVNRIDYNVGSPSWILQNEVDIKVKVEVSGEI